MSSSRRHPGALLFYRRSAWLLVGLAIASLIFYALIAELSERFQFDTDPLQRPILAALGLFGLAFVCYLAAIWVVRRAAEGEKLLGAILLAAVAFRVVLLFSTSILEIDIYRYLWDGSVSAQGVSPFRYSPQQVKEATGEGVPADLARLVETRDRSPALATILDRVHFAQLPTIYPPVSQVVFAVSDLTTPAGSSVAVRLMIMKAWLIAFDLATLALIVQLLRIAGRPVCWCIVYAWCPLLMKEVANSGHLDAIAVFLTTLSIWLAARAFFPFERKKPSGGAEKLARGGLVQLVGSAVVLGLAVGAKLYPIVLAPLLLISVARRFGWRQSALPGLALAATVCLVLYPMAPKWGGSANQPPAAQIAAVDELPPFPAAEDVILPSDPSLGLKIFMRQWEINDFFFLLLIENVRPTAHMPAKNVAWFTVMPERWRADLTSAVAQSFSIDSAHVPFLIARSLTGLTFLFLAVCFAWRAGRSESVEDWLRGGFLTLAWFWLLLPTQNPWYWIWALPLLPFARGRAWLVLAGLAMIYYLRFWLNYHWPETPLLMTRYPGMQFFDFIITWIEFAPWLVWLGVEFMVALRFSQRAGKNAAKQKAAEILSSFPRRRESRTMTVKSGKRMDSRLRGKDG